MIASLAVEAPSLMVSESAVTVGAIVSCGCACTVSAMIDKKLEHTVKVVFKDMLDDVKRSARDEVLPQLRAALFTLRQSLDVAKSATR